MLLSGWKPCSVKLWLIPETDISEYWPHGLPKHVRDAGPICFEDKLSDFSFDGIFYCKDSEGA